MQPTLWQATFLAPMSARLAATWPPTTPLNRLQSHSAQRYGRRPRSARLVAIRHVPVAVDASFASVCMLIAVTVSLDGGSILTEQLTKRPNLALKR